MTSAIDPTKPAEGNAYTADVRANFTTASSEISDLQNQVATALSNITTLQNQITALQSDIATLKSRQMVANSVITSDAPNTNSSVYVMATDAVPFSTHASTRGIVIVDGRLGNTNNASGSDLELYFGTGPAPTAGTLMTLTNGVVIGAGTSMLATRAGDFDPFSVAGLLLDLGARAQYWVGVGIRAQSGTATLSQLSVLVFEILDPLP